MYLILNTTISKFSDEMFDFIVLLGIFHILIVDLLQVIRFIPFVLLFIFMPFSLSTFLAFQCLFNVCKSTEYVLNYLFPVLLPRNSWDDSES